MFSLVIIFTFLWKSLSCGGPWATAQFPPPLNPALDRETDRHEQSTVAHIASTALAQEQTDPEQRIVANIHPFNGPLSATTRVGRYQKGKTIFILLKQGTVSGSGISWAICKSAHRSRQITTPAPHRSVFYRPVALPAAQPTASKH